MKKSITPIGAPVGIDVHKRRCKVVEFDEGQIKLRKAIANTREEWLEMLTELPPDAEEEEKYLERVKKLTRMCNWGNRGLVDSKHEHRHCKHSGWSSMIGCGESASIGHADD